MRRRNFVLATIAALLPFNVVVAKQRLGGELCDYFRDPWEAMKIGLGLRDRGAKCGAVSVAEGKFESRKFELLHKRDLAHGDIVIAGGWIVSQSEAEACLQLVSMGAGGLAI